MVISSDTFDKLLANALFLEVQLLNVLDAIVSRLLIARSTLSILISISSRTSLKSLASFLALELLFPPPLFPPPPFPPPPLDDLDDDVAFLNEPPPTTFLACAVPLANEPPIMLA